MGWSGFGILEGDPDMDAIADVFDSEVVEPLKEDVIRLRLKVWEQKMLKKKSEEAKNGTKDGSDQPDPKPSTAELEEDWEWDVGLDSPRFPRLVRDFLDSGVLNNLIKRHSPKRANGKWTEDHKKLVLIAYCAMQLGCTLPPGFLGRLKSNYHRVGLWLVGDYQMFRACNEYVDGKPFTFISLDTREIEIAALEMEGIGLDGELGKYTQRPHPQPPGLESIPSQEAAVANEQPAQKRRKVESNTAALPIIEEYYLHFPHDTCANCGATRGHGTTDLKRCKGCKTTLYCFEGCQKWHWHRHSDHCAVEQEDEESANGESTDKGGDVSKEETEKATA